MNDSEDAPRHRREMADYFRKMLTAVRAGAPVDQMQSIVNSFCLVPQEDDYEEVYGFYLILLLTRNFSTMGERLSILLNCAEAMMEIDPKRYSRQDVLIEVLLARYRRATQIEEAMIIAELIGVVIWPQKDPLAIVEKMPVRYPRMSETSVRMLHYLLEQIEDPLAFRYAWIASPRWKSQ